MLAAERRNRECGQRDLARAWLTATFTRAQRLEGLDHYLKPPMTIAEKLLARHAAGTPMKITVTKRGV